MKSFSNLRSILDLRLGHTLAMVALLSGCSLAPTYSKPDVGLAPAAFKEDISTRELAPGEIGQWKIAAPSEDMRRGEWWKVFADSTLNEYEQIALDANQNLKAAAARLKQSRGIQQAADAAFFPNVDGGVGAKRQQFSGASQFDSDDKNGPAQTLWRAQLGASYEPDLFGRVSDTAEAAKAETQQSEAIFRSVQLAVQADVAQNYFMLRQLDSESAVMADTVSLREQQVTFLQRRFDEGDISELDVVRARSLLAIARSDEMSVQRRRATYEHKLAVLLDKAPSTFAMSPKPLEEVAIRIPGGLPSSLLERRPDIAAAERQMAAANARIGVARAAYFPSLSLTGAAGFESASLSNLFQWSTRTFLLGPLNGTALSIPIFDGGKRDGNLANARAVYEEDSAKYKQQVLVAFREVEDRLADLRIIEQQTQTQNAAISASSRAAELSREQYDNGMVAYLDVIDSDRTLLQTRLSGVKLSGARAASTVNLIRALGGGWDEIPETAGMKKL
ncbi:Toluene efflux pump outer membrane protein TtgF [Pseudomonas fluorescens]|jgi:multidrug efflux system outer membrane protein|nr:Toluene efflux pump outer membrane protein TtgF [Pseudomonas fluorescens]